MRDMFICLSFIVVVFGLFGATHVVKSYFEAQAYYRVAGKEVTTWDALFLQLRVDGCDN